MPYVEGMAFRIAAALVTVAAAAQTPPPMTLDEVLNEALSRNLQLLAERFNISAGEARILQARLKPNPILNVNANYLDWLGAGLDPQASPAGPTEFSVALDYIVERGRKRQERVAVAEAAKAMAQVELLNTTRTLVLDVQNAFTDVLLAKANLALTQASVDAFNGIVSINRTRVDAGDLARVELVRSEVAALQFRNELRIAELRLRVAKNRLQQLIGRSVFRPDFDVLGEMRKEPLLSDKTEVLTAALVARPDLEALKRDQVRTQADIRLQLAQGKVDLVVSGAYNHQVTSMGFRPGNTVGFQLLVPLPVYNRNQGEIERARQEQAQAEARVRSLSQEIAAEVENAYEQYTTAKTLLETIETEMLEQSRRVRDVIEFSYRRGEATFVELLDAQRTLNETIQGFNGARAEYAKSLFLIDSIAGKGYTR
jgi:cobalt-zinc-cadmium efflux system outer membrane protein